MTDPPEDPSRRRRRLAAILMADVVGFTRLMGRDDEGTTSRILDFHHRVKATIEWHSGRVVATAGDSVFGEFESILQALDCAAEIQRSLHEANAGLLPEDRIEARIGLHLGDVIVEEYNVFGDGVNIAARLESLADPGGILMSEAVYQQVKGYRDLPIREAGVRHLKNVEHPVRVYRIAPEVFGGSGGKRRIGIGGPPRSAPGSGSRRWMLWIAAAVLVVAGAGIAIAIVSGGDDGARAAGAETAATSTTAVPTSTTTSTSTSTTSTTTTTTLPLPAGAFRPDTADLPPASLDPEQTAMGSGCVVGDRDLWDGPWYGYVEDRGGDSIEFDLACFFTGEAAAEEADADGEALIGDHYVRNLLKRTKTLDLHPGAVAFFPVADGALGQVLASEWPTGVSIGCPGEACGVWIYLNGGRVTAIVEYGP